jgi:DNA polymerase epsilon subunit 1
MGRGRGSFGLTPRTRGRGTSRGSWRGGSWRGGRGRGRGVAKAPGDPAPAREDDGTQLTERFERVSLSDEIDEKLGFEKVQEGERKEGWLINMHTV